MKLKKLNPTTNGARHTIKIKKNLLSKTNRIVRSILTKKINRSGKSSTTGKTTVWHKGGAVKKLYRNTGYLRASQNSVVIASCYDPNRSAFVNLNFELEKTNFFFNIATNSILPGTLLKSANDINELKLGYRTQIKNIPTGSIINNLTINNSQKVKYIKSAGTFGQIIQRGHKRAKIKLPSKEVIEVSNQNLATIGVVSNVQHNLTVIGKAGVNRHKGIRPTVRGIAMNPVDHPHGGRTNGGKPSVSPWGIPTKGGFYLKKKRK
jgi:large subunit ribosomal protein L2